MAKARIYKPAKTSTQSGLARTREWILEFEQASQRRPDPLMGWSSAEDTLNEVKLHFESREQAEAYARAQGLDYEVWDPQPKRFKPKAYADNFRYDKVR